MITVNWFHAEDGYWHAHVSNEESAFALKTEGYAPLPGVKATATSRQRNRAVAYALEDLAAKLKEEP